MPVLARFGVFIVFTDSTIIHTNSISLYGSKFRFFQKIFAPVEIFYRHLTQSVLLQAKTGKTF